MQEAGFGKSGPQTLNLLSSKLVLKNGSGLLIGESSHYSNRVGEYLHPYSQNIKQLRSNNTLPQHIFFLREIYTLLEEMIDAWQ